MFFVCLAATFMGMLNARGFFFIPALGATLLNVVMIFTVVWLVPMIEGGLSTQIFALAYAVLVAGVAQAFFQWPFLHKNGYRWRWVSPWSHPTVQEVVRKMIPGTIGVAAFQLNMLITQGVAYWIDSGSTGSIIASFNYAVRLMEFPQGVFGVSLFTYLLSALSGYVAQKDYVSFRKTLCDGLHYLSFVNVFAMAVTLVLAGPIVRMVYEGGQFTPDSSSRTSAALLSLAPSLLAFSYVGSLARSFYALGDVKTPMTISIFCLFINLLLALILIHPFRQAGLGMANSISSWINFALLTYALRHKLKRLEWTNLPREIVQMILCAVIAAQVAWVIYHFGFQRSLQIPSPSFWLKLVSVVAPLSGAFLVYWSAASFLRIRATMDIIHTIKSRRNEPLPD
jgi:putative peptidoglycan lipid II flippase